MFEQMRKPGPAGFLARRSNMRRQRDCDHRIGTINVKENGEPIVQSEGLIWQKSLVFDGVGRD